MRSNIIPHGHVLISCIVFVIGISVFNLTCLWAAEENGKKSIPNIKMNFSPELEKSLLEYIAKRKTENKTNNKIIVQLPKLEALISEKLALPPWWMYAGPYVLAIVALVVSFITNKKTQKISSDQISAQIANTATQNRNQRNALAQHEQLKYVNDQLTNFYGPMLALCRAGDRLWIQFCDWQKRHPDDYFGQTTDPEKAKESDGNKPTGENLQAYVRVMKDSFQPLNQERVKLIKEHGGLAFISGEEDFLGTLIDIIAHTAELEASIKKWEKCSDSAGGIYGKSVIWKEVWDQEEANNRPHGGKTFFQPSISFPSYVGAKRAKLTDKVGEIYTQLETRQRDLYTDLGLS